MFLMKSDVVPGCEVDLSPLPTAEVKNEWRSICTPPFCLHSMDRENFTFLLPLPYNRPDV
jgi:hypothetical protein